MPRSANDATSKIEALCLRLLYALANLWLAMLRKCLWPHRGHARHSGFAYIVTVTSAMWFAPFLPCMPYGRLIRMRG